MKNKEWEFNDVPDVMVMTTKDIVNNIKPILLVWHDVDDGMWQFLDGSDVEEEQVMIVSLEEIVKIDKTVEAVSDLPLGWIAWRKEIDSEWMRQQERE